MELFADEGTSEGGVASSFGIRELVWRPGSVIAPLLGGWLMVEVSMASVFYVGGAFALTGAATLFVFSSASAGFEASRPGDDRSPSRQSRGETVEPAADAAVGRPPSRIDRTAIAALAAAAAVASEGDAVALLAAADSEVDGDGDQQADAADDRAGDRSEDGEGDRPVPDDAQADAREDPGQQNEDGRATHGGADPRDESRRDRRGTCVVRHRGGTVHRELSK